MDVELSKRCFQVTRTVKFAKMAKKFPPDSAKTPGLRVTPPRMPKLQHAKRNVTVHIFGLSVCVCFNYSFEELSY